jgi:hypothetical protein
MDQRLPVKHDGLIQVLVIASVIEVGGESICKVV